MTDIFFATSSKTPTPSDLQHHKTDGAIAKYYSLPDMVLLVSIEEGVKVVSNSNTWFTKVKVNRENYLKIIENICLFI